ncbi:unnamed protein product [Anisakis simplex]|uniref:Uncharacterized protein n=1 Tax=Anisakis simplex TaxID=6269 RepID=A0A0M3JDW1_ANISI|nr:unnamed protein product [Anisakis simplex]
MTERLRENRPLTAIFKSARPSHNTNPEYLFSWPLSHAFFVEELGENEREVIEEEPMTPEIWGGRQFNSRTNAWRKQKFCAIAAAVRTEVNDMSDIKISVL